MTSPKKTCEVQRCDKESDVYCDICKKHFYRSDYRKHSFSDSRHYRHDRRNRQRGRRALRNRRHRGSRHVKEHNSPSDVTKVTNDQPTAQELNNFRCLIESIFNLQAEIRCAEGYSNPTIFADNTFLTTLYEARMIDMNNDDDDQNRLGEFLHSHLHELRMQKHGIDQQPVIFEQQLNFYRPSDKLFGFFHKSDQRFPLTIPDIIPFVVYKYRIVIHFHPTDEPLLERIINQFEVPDYKVYMHNVIPNFSHDIGNTYVIPCLTCNYENNFEKQGELEYAFKSQYHIIPIRLQTDFIPQQMWLRQMLQLINSNMIDIIESVAAPVTTAATTTMTTTTTCTHNENLMVELLKYKQFSDDYIERNEPLDKSKYSKIYEECCKQHWNDIPRLLLHVNGRILESAFDENSLFGIECTINLLSKLNNQFQEQAQNQIDSFQIWLTEMARIKKKKERLESIQQQEQIKNARAGYNQQKMLEKVKEAMKIFIQKTQSLSDTFNSLSINDLNERTKSKTHSSSKENNDNNLVSLKHSNSIDKKNCTIQSSVEQNQNVSTVSTQSSYKKIPPRFTSDSLEWTVPYPESAIKSAQIRDYLERPQFIRKPFDAVFQRYIRCYLALEGFSNEHINQLEITASSSIVKFLHAYTSVTNFHKAINRHLAMYGLAYFNTTFDTCIPYSFVHCLLSIVATLLCEIRLQDFFIGKVYRGMMMNPIDLQKYIKGSCILTTSFLSTSKQPALATIYSGYDKGSTSSTHDDDKTEISVLCIYEIRNYKTAIDVHHLTTISGEDEIVIFPFSAFRVAEKMKDNMAKVVTIYLEECDVVEWRENISESQWIYSST